LIKFAIGIYCSWTFFLKVFVSLFLFQHFLPYSYKPISTQKYWQCCKLFLSTFSETCKANVFNGTLGILFIWSNVRSWFFWSFLSTFYHNVSLTKKFGFQYHV
jgi:hypothetical protein